MARLLVGARVGPYEILDLLGVGGVGEVYRARDSRLDRTVAIKILKSPGATGSIQLQRFQREAKAIASLSHPHICTLYDVGEEDGVAFLVMEWLDGQTLAERLERGPFSVESALQIGSQVAEALDAAHRKGIVHRDLKAANVIFAPGGVKLLDFGLAKLREAEYEEMVRGRTQSLQLTSEGTLIGTLPYMAPEQIEGHYVDSRTDIFSLGVLLHEMLAGRRPFAGDTRASLMVAILAGAPASLAEVRPAVPEALQRLVRRCLEKDPDDRWQTARDLAAELQWIARGDTNAIPVRRIRLRRRHRAVILSRLAVGALVVGAGTAMMMLRWQRAAVAEYQALTYRRGVVSSARFAHDGQSFVYSASWEGRQYGIFLGRPESPDVRDLGLETGRILSISRTGEMAVLFGSQNIQQAFGVLTLARVPLAGGARRDLLEGVVDADWIPGTDRLAVIRDPGGGRPWRVEFPEGTVVHESRAAWSLRVSPDGKRIAFFEGPSLFGSAPEAKVMMVDTSGQKTILSSGWSGIGLAWMPSGKEVWFTATDGGVSDGKANARRDHRPAAPWLHAVSLSGSERTVHRAPDWLVLHDIAADGRLLMSRNTARVGLACQAPGETAERDLSWLMASAVTDLSPDGRTVIFFDGLSGLTRAANPILFRRSTTGEAAVPVGEGAAGRLSPDGRWVLASLVQSLVLLPAGAGSAVVLPKGNLSSVGAGAWLPGSKQIVFNGTRGNDRPRIYIQEIPAGEPLAVTDEGVQLPANAAVRNQNSLLGRSGDNWMLFPIAGGDPQSVPALTGRDVPIQWSQDGRFVYTVGIAEWPRPSAFDVFLVDIRTGRRALWKTLAPADRVGVEEQRQWTAITPDARAYCYSYARRLGDLFVVSKLQ
jgi:Tol biopolymer transport system component